MFVVFGCFFEVVSLGLLLNEPAIIVRNEVTAWRASKADINECQETWLNVQQLLQKKHYKQLQKTLKKLQKATKSYKQLQKAWTHKLHKLLKNLQQRTARNYKTRQKTNYNKNCKKLQKQLNESQRT